MREYTLKKTSINLIISVLFTITSFSLMLSDLRSESSALKAGIEAMNRGHYATALRAFRKLAKTESWPKITLGICTSEAGVPERCAALGYKRSASKDLPEAEYNAGLLYHYGYGVAKNRRGKKMVRNLLEKVLLTQNL